MKDLLQVVSLEYSLAILEALESAPEGLRYKDFRMVENNETRSSTLEKLVESGLVEKSDGNIRGAPYLLTRKGAKALQFAKALMKLDP
jgi:DNA-binding HxlR family transcriptional regulator